MRYCSADIKDVKVLKNYELYLQFDDGHDGTIDVSKIISFEGVFEPLKNQDYFKSVSLNHELGTITWSNGADISPVMLYEHTRK